MSLHRSLLEKPRSQEPFGVNSEVFVQKGCDQALFGIVSELFFFKKDLTKHYFQVAMDLWTEVVPLTVVSSYGHIPVAATSVQPPESLVPTSRQSTPYSH